MQKQTIEFVIRNKNTVVTEITKSTIYQPKTNFKGGFIKWYEDKSKKEVNRT